MITTVRWLAGLAIFCTGWASICFAQASGISIVDPIKQGQRLGDMTTAGVLGAVAVCAIIGMVLVGRQLIHAHKAEREQSRVNMDTILKVINENTKAHQQVSDHQLANTEALRAVQQSMDAMNRRHNGS